MSSNESKISWWWLLVLLACIAALVGLEEML
jgi:hypothetical protein